MDKRERRFDWGLLLALALGLFAAFPFLTRPGLPHQTDAELHIYRAAELGHALRKGVLYPRWAPNLYYGYGYPIFNYYAPLTYYLANLLNLLPGLTIVGGVKAVFVLGLVVAALGAHLLGRELFSSPAAGVLAAASFTFAPYIAFIDPHARGDLAEHFAICLLPLSFYFFHRLMIGAGGRWSLLGSVLTLAAIVFSHNLLGLVSAGLLLAYWLWMVTLGEGKRQAGWGLLSFSLAAALIAFFWLPALMEKGAIKLQVIGPGHFDFREHFLTMGEMLAPSRIFDLGATAPRYRHNIGLAQWLLSLLAFPALAVSWRHREDSERCCHLAYFILAGLGLIFLNLPASKAIWELVPGMPYLQFPWRLLGPINLMLAICAASGVTLLPKLLPDASWRYPWLASTLTVILLLALKVLYPPTWAPDFGGTSPRDIIQWERRSQALGTTSTGDFLPKKAAQVSMRPVESLLSSYDEPGPIDKVNRASLPEGARVEVIDHGPLHDHFKVFAPSRFVLRLYTFDFPGWRAYVDGEEVDIELGRPEGFITLWVPEGEHDVQVRFEDTPPRTAGWIISAIGAVMLIIALWLFRAPRPNTCIHGLTYRTDPSLVLWVGGALGLVILLKVFITDPQGWLRYQSPPGQVLAAEHQLEHVNFGDEIELLGYDLPKQRVRAGKTLSLVLYWRALKPVEENYQTFVHLAQPLHVVWGQEDHLNPGGLPTTRWTTDKYVWDDYNIHVPPDTPAGEYKINVGLYLKTEGRRLKRYDQYGNVAGDSVVITSVEVK